jgi:hypothetical protein
MKPKFTRANSLMQEFDGTVVGPISKVWVMISTSET